MFDFPQGESPPPEIWSGKILASLVECEQTRVQEFMKKAGAGTLLVNGWKEVRFSDLLVFSFIGRDKVSEAIV